MGYSKLVNSVMYVGIGIVMGFLLFLSVRLVQQCDTRIAAAAAGLDLRPLLTAEIQGHLNDFNLDAGLTNLVCLDALI